MSKVTYSKKISESLYTKIKYINYIDIESLFKKDENFEIAICVAYLTLSKEKIIKKDIKNQDRLGRLTEKVDTEEIDKVFKPGFAKEMPTIIYSRETDNVWKLDNIRDSIMHGAFEIDEDNKCFIINNNQHNREFVASIPFSWFIAYAKNDILSKRISSSYTIRGFYYNKYKKGKYNLTTHKELLSNILYRVNVYGNKFNVKDLENRIKELFNIYSQDETSDEVIEKYKDKITKENSKYNEKYLISFFIASEKVKEIIEKEYPGVNLNIYVDNRKHKFINKTSKKLPKYIQDYDALFNVINNALIPRGTTSLVYITKIIENIDTFKLAEENKDNLKENIKALHKLLTGEDIDKYYKDLRTIASQDLKTLLSVYLNIYGLSTLVINQENLYNPYFLNEHPSQFGLKVCTKQPYYDYATKRKSLIMQNLETEITLFQKQDQYSKCKNEQAKTKIKETIDTLLTKIKQNENTLSSLEHTTQFERVIKEYDFDYKEAKHIEDTINEYYKHFHEAKSPEIKNKIRKIIGALLDSQMEIESKYTYSSCNNMKDTLTIIRNCFSHTGRISLGKINGALTTVVLTDYDNFGEKSGEVICKYRDLIQLLSDPYQVDEELKRKTSR